jgi:multidrug transporter EmrE-like cation transporter
MFGEKVNYVQFTGLGIFLFSAYLLISGSKKIKADFSPATLFLLLLSMLANGATMLFQKMYGLSGTDSGAAFFSFFTFAPASVILGAAVLIWITVTRKAKNRVGPADSSAETDNGAATDGGGERQRILSPTKKLYIYGIVLSAIVFVINQLATLAASLVPSVVLFGLINGGATVISFVVGAVFFEENVNLKNLAGIILGVGSLIMLNVTF